MMSRDRFRDLSVKSQVPILSIVSVQALGLQKASLTKCVVLVADVQRAEPGVPREDHAEIRPGG